ncbi:MAG: transposase [bacterium]|nr:transposase [bacterium]
MVISDRYSGYLFIDLDQRQVCFAHLIRDFRRMAKGEKDLRWIGERLLRLTQAVFRLWHLFQDGEIERMQTASATLRQKGRSPNDFIVNIAHAMLGDKPSQKLLG